MTSALKLSAGEAEGATGRSSACQRAAIAPTAHRFTSAAAVIHSGLAPAAAAATPAQLTSWKAQPMAASSISPPAARMPAGARRAVSTGAASRSSAGVSSTARDTASPTRTRAFAGGATAGERAASGRDLRSSEDS